MQQTELERLIEQAHVLPIRIWPDPILNQQCTKCEESVDVKKEMVAAMIKTMRHHNGVGLAAPQIGITTQICIIETSSFNDPIVLINPSKVIPDSKAATFETNEGCLSIPGYFEDRTRYGSIMVEAENIDGVVQTHQLYGLDAFVAQHELEHLDGKLFIDHLSPFKLKRIKRKVEKTLKSR